MNIVVLLGLIMPLNGQIGRVDQDTYVIAHLNEKLPANTNIVYTPTIRASWTLLRDEIVGEDLVLTKPLSLVAGLNCSLFKTPDNEEWLAMAGFVENGILKDINKAMQSKFGIESRLNHFTDDEGIICYAYLNKILRFNQTFETLNWKFHNHTGSQNVECLGVSKGSETDKVAMREQVRIYDYRNPDDFIVKISSRDPQKEIILAKVTWGGTLPTMIREIDNRINLPGKDKLSSKDELVIPKVAFDIEHSYDDFLGLHLKNKGFEDYFFTRFEQDISFRLDESGAEAIATGEIVLKKGPRSRLYIFDKPFLIILKDIGNSEPDLVVWVSNPAILKLAE